MKKILLFTTIFYIGFVNTTSNSEVNWRKKILPTVAFSAGIGLSIYLLNRRAKINSPEFVKFVRQKLEQEKKWGWDEASVNQYIRKTRLYNNLLLFLASASSVILARNILKK